MSFLQRISEQMNKLWKEMPFARKFGFVVLSLVCVTAIIGVGYWAAQPDYRILYSNLSAEDAGAVTAKLQSKNVPFKLEAGGTTVLVPAEHLQQAKVDLAMEGLPSGGEKGWNLFDENSLGMTPAQEHVKYGRALQAELAKTIMQLQPVAHARVHIARPEPSPFVRDQKPTTASVVIKLKPGATLGRQTATGIVAMVARSVDGLAPENVTVLDTNGRILSDRSGGEAGGIASSQLEYKRELEAYLSAKAEEMLGQYLGPGRAVVRVTADIDMQKLTQTQTIYDADNKVPATEEITSSKQSGNSTTAGGPAGTASNVKGSPASAGSKGDKREEESTRTTYLVPKTTREMQKLAGSVERLTVAAMVDLTPAEGATAPPLPLASVENIIKRAVGFNTDRKDEITVSDVKLAVPVAVEPDAEWLASQQWRNYVDMARHASIGVASVVVLLLGWLILRRMRPTAAPAAAPETKAAPTEADPLTALAQRDPDAIARLLKSWIEEQTPARRAA